MFSRVCTSISCTLQKSAQMFSVAAQVCTAFKPCRPKFRVPGSGFRVLLACGSSCWMAVTLIPQTFSLNTGDPAQPGAPISRAGPVEARPGGAVPGQSRPGPAAPSRSSRGPARPRVRASRGPARGRSPGVVEAAKCARQREECPRREQVVTLVTSLVFIMKFVNT